MYTDNDPVAELQSLEIKSRFDSYASRKSNYLTNSAEFLRSLVQPDYTPTYQSASAYITPEVVTSQKSSGWHLWVINQDQGTKPLDLLITVSRDGLADVSVNAAGIDVNQSTSELLAELASKLGSTSPLVFRIHCDTCILVETDDGSVITDVRATLS